MLTDGAGTTALGDGRRRPASGSSPRRSTSVARRREPAQPSVVVVQAMPKGDRGELAVEMLTEVGVDVIVPWAASRSVSVWRGDSAAKSLAKWRATAREAAKQARRSWFPEVADAGHHRRGRRPARGAPTARRAPRGAVGPLADLPVPGRGEIVIVVGPEGGHQRRGAGGVRGRRRRAGPAGRLGAAHLDRRRRRHRRPARPHPPLALTSPPRCRFCVPRCVFLRVEVSLLAIEQRLDAGDLVVEPGRSRRVRSRNSSVPIRPSLHHHSPASKPSTNTRRADAAVGPHPAGRARPVRSPWSRSACESHTLS